MNTNKPTSIDHSLLELIQPHRPSSEIKLIAAWSGLSIETQIKILSTVDHIPDEIIKKGLGSSNDYVRYLIVNKFGICNFENGNLEEQALFDKISNDNGIAKYALKTSQAIFVREQNERGNIVSILKPENFFSLSKEEQIMYFSELTVSDGETIAKIIEWGLTAGSIEKDHIKNLIIECSSNFEKFKSSYDYDYDDFDGYTEYCKSKCLKALWELAPKLDSISAQLLVLTLPPRITEEILNSLEKKLLIHVLQRKDVYQTVLRWNIVYCVNKQYDDDIRKAAASTNFYITDNQFFKYKHTLKSLKDTKAYIKIDREMKKYKHQAIRGFFWFILILLIPALIFFDAPKGPIFLCAIFLAVMFLDNLINSLNNKIDEAIERIDKKIKRRLKKL